MTPSDPLRSAVSSQEPKHNPHYVVGLEKSIEDAEEAGHALGYERCVWYLADIIKDLGQKLALASASASVPEIGVELSCLLCGLVKPWGSWERGVAVCRECRDAAWLYRRGFATASASPQANGEGWQSIETAPKMRTILLFAVTDVDEHGTVKNWKMATGSWHTGYEDARSKAEGITPWTWDGHQVKVYELHPTHWQPLPPPPSARPASLEPK